MPIDLLKLAKQVEETYYLDVELSFGETVRVYHVLDTVVWRLKPDRPAPVLPVIKMKTATGFQNRPAKESDPEYQEWLKDQEAYDEERIELQAASRYVKGLKDIQYPDISKPPPNAAKEEYLNGDYPDNELLRKRIWLNHTILARRSDRDKIYGALVTLNEQKTPDADSVDSIKKNSEYDSEGDG